MARARRRTTVGRSRRKPVKTQAGGGPNLPLVPIMIVFGLVAVVGLIGYLIWQQSQPAGDSSAEWVQMEADPAPDLPGEYVNLPEIYGGSYGAHGQNATALHVTRDVDYAAAGNSNPPAGGPHWGRGCLSDPSESPPFCGPAPWGIYREAWPPETVVHNMEHGGLVLWYNTTDEAIISELEDLVKGRLDRNVLLVMTPYPDMEEETIAMTAWTRIDKFSVSDYTKDRVEEFIRVFDRRFNPEEF